MGAGASCCADVAEFNPDGTQKPAQTVDQKFNDPIDLRKAARECDLELMDELVKRMLISQINSGAKAAEGAQEDTGNTALHFSASNNHLRGVKKLILYGSGLDPRNSFRKTPLFLALEAGKKKVSTFLIARGADLNAADSSGVSPFLVLLLSGQKSLVQWLLATYPNKVSYANLDRSGTSCLTIAARYGWWDTLLQLLDLLRSSAPEASAATLNARNRDGETPLGWVLKFAASGRLSEVEAAMLQGKLLDAGASPVGKAFAENVPLLSLAAATGYKSVFDRILEAQGPAPLTTSDSLGRTVLHYAAAKGHADIASVVIERGLVPFQLDSRKDTPLHLAAVRGHPSVAKLLLEKSEDPQLALLTPNKDGLTVYHLGLKGGARPDAQKAALAMLEVLGDAEKCGTLVQNKELDTPLLLAVRSHQDLVVKALLEKQLPVDQANALGELPLTANLAAVTAATFQQDSAIFDALLAAGAEVETPVEAAHPLLALCKNENSMFAKMAVARLPAPAGTSDKELWDKKDAEGRGPLHLAALHNNQFLVHHLLGQVQMDIEVQDPFGRTPLMYAAWGASPDTLVALLNKGANPRAIASYTPPVPPGTPATAPPPRTEESSVLSYCLKLDKPASLVCAAALLNAGAEPENCVDLAGEGLLHRAVRYGCPDFIRLWSSAKGDFTFLARTPFTADDVPGAEGKAKAKLDYLDEEAEAKEDAGAHAEEEVEEESDHEEEECCKKKAAAAEAVAGAVAESREEEWGAVEGSWASSTVVDGFELHYSGPSKAQMRTWTKQGASWFDGWLNDTHAGPGQEVLWDDTHDDDQDWVLEAKEGPICEDDATWEILERQASGRSSRPGPVAESLMDSMAKNLSTKVMPVNDLLESASLLVKGSTSNEELASLEDHDHILAMKLAKENQEKLIKERSLELSDTFYHPGKLYSGKPACMQVDVSVTPKSKIQELVAQMEKRLSGYTGKLEDVTLVGPELRERNIEWWIKSLSPEEYPLKLGRWRRVLQLLPRAKAAAGKRAPTAVGAKTVTRKRTAWFGLPDLPTRPEHEDTSALVYAVRLCRPACVQAILESQHCACLNLEDLWGHTPIDYAMAMLTRDKLNVQLQAMADLLLSKLPYAPGSFSAGTSNPMNPVCLAVMANDAPRLAWLVKKCAASLNSTTIFLPDIPSYYAGLWEKLVGDTDSHAHPLHLAILNKRMDLVRLILDLGADPNKHAEGVCTIHPHKLRGTFLSDYQALQSSSTMGPQLTKQKLQVMASRRAAATQEAAAVLAWKAKKVAESTAAAAAIADLGALGQAAAVAGGVVKMVKDLVVSLLAGPDPWLSPLHLACRFGLADSTSLLLDRGALITGGAAAQFARLTPLEMSLRYARANFTHDNTPAERHNWTAMRKRIVQPIPSMSLRATEKQARSMMMAFVDPVQLSIKAAIAMAKVVLQLVMESFKRPISHADPAMKCAHVLLLNRTPIRSYTDAQVNIVMRDVLDNGTWMWMGVSEVEDRKWLKVVEAQIAELQELKECSFEEMGKTEDPAKYKKMAKKYKSLADARFVKAAIKEFGEAWKVHCAAAGDQAKDRSKERTQKLLQQYQENVTEYAANVQELAKESGGLQGAMVAQLSALQAQVVDFPEAAYEDVMQASVIGDVSLEALLEDPGGALANAALGWVSDKVDARLKSAVADVKKAVGAADIKLPKRSMLSNLTTLSTAEEKKLVKEMQAKVLEELTTSLGIPSGGDPATALNNWALDSPEAANITSDAQLDAMFELLNGEMDLDLDGLLALAAQFKESMNTVMEMMGMDLDL